MERVNGAAETKQAKQGKAAAKKGIKVVCISNPMKFKTSASEFRALVQKLTGQDSDIDDIMSRYHQYPSVDIDEEAEEAEEADQVSEASSKVTHPAAGDPTYVCPLQLLDGAFNSQTTTAAAAQEEFPWLIMPSAHHNATQGCEVWDSNED